MGSTDPIHTDFPYWLSAWDREHSEAALRKLEREEARLKRISTFRTEREGQGELIFEE